MKSFTRLFESKSEYVIYHKSYTDAIREALKQIEKRGFTYSEDEYQQKVALGRPKPSDGKTNRIQLTPFKNNKEQRVTANFQIYRKDTDTFELNFYIN